MILSKQSKIGFTSESLTIDGTPWFPVMGEMHYSRYPQELWEQELYKMKAGGMDIVSTYVIWIHHEEVKGEFDFSGLRNLHSFLDKIQKSGLYGFLRIGPWVHGEVRNGGFPDWLLQEADEKDFILRSDAPQYLKAVRSFWEKIFEQTQGFLLKDGGPVIGIQIENEYGHVGGQRGEIGEIHMQTLMEMAKEIGFDVPIYTATGWGGAVTGGAIPVMGGYCEAPWDPRLTEIEPSGNYIFTNERNDHNIGSDHGLGTGITFEMNKYPYLTAELGGGLQVTAHRRPIASGSDIGAMSMVKIGSGCNLLGYYMYHGGTNPQGRLTTLQESTETGYPNDLPEKSYDFWAPIREYGQFSDTYREIRKLSLFVHDYQDRLCHMPYISQAGNPQKPGDLTSLRTAVRGKKQNDITEGFLFVNNYQRRYRMSEKTAAELTAYDAQGEVIVRYPQRDIHDGDYFFYPFNLQIGNGRLKRCLATPLCILHGAGMQGADAYVFYGDNDPQYDFEISPSDGTVIITLTCEEALHASKIIKCGKEYLFISASEIVPNSENGYDLLCMVKDQLKEQFAVWPNLQNVSASFTKIKQAETLETFVKYENFAVYEMTVSLQNTATCKIVQIQKGESCHTYELIQEHLDANAEEIFADIDYQGNTAKMYQNDLLQADNFYTGQTWQIGIKRFMEGNEKEALKMKIEVTPLYKNAKLYLQTWPEFEGDKVCEISSIDTRSLYRKNVF